MKKPRSIFINVRVNEDEAKTLDVMIGELAKIFPGIDWDRSKAFRWMLNGQNVRPGAGLP